MKKDTRYAKLLKSISYYLTFFLLVAFVITCCMTLFLNVASHSLNNFEFTEENINTAAKLTFLNVLLLSLIFSVVDWLRRIFTVERPMKRITDTAEKLMQGDFNVRIETRKNILSDNTFNEVAECFNKVAEELKSVETLRTDFISNVSHELKTPLAVIQNYGTLLQSPDIDDEKRIEYAKAINAATKKLSNMMTNILKLNRLENQQIYPKSERYDLGEQLCECLLQFENIWERDGIEIDTDIEDNVTVTADRELLELVWNNLFSNAFKFTGSGGRVTVRLSASEHHAVVEVSDTGCGMSPEVGAHIFEKFYQGDTSRASAGNGLGLALVKKVIDVTKGEISVQSELGVGSTFRVRIRR